MQSLGRATKSKIFLTCPDIHTHIHTNTRTDRQTDSDIRSNVIHSRGSRKEAARERRKVGGNECILVTRFKPFPNFQIYSAICKS